MIVTNYTFLRSILINIHNLMRQMHEIELPSNKIQFGLTFLAASFCLRHHAIFKVTRFSPNLCTVCYFSQAKFLYRVGRVNLNTRFLYVV